MHLSFCWAGSATDTARLERRTFLGVDGIRRISNLLTIPVDNSRRKERPVLVNDVTRPTRCVEDAVDHRFTSRSLRALNAATLARS